MISTGKGVEKFLGRKGRRSGGKKANRGKGGEDLRKEQGEALRGGKVLGGKGWEGSNKKRVWKILGRKREKILGEKGEGC